MNKFLWKIEDTCIDYTPVTVIRNAITKKQCVKIVEELHEYVDSEHDLESKKFNEDNNPGCWRGFPTLAPDDVPGLSAENKDLVRKTIEEAGKHYLKSWPQAEKLSFTTWQADMFSEEFNVQIWFNINQKGSANMIHNHHGALFSGVFYFQAEGTGALRLYPENFLLGNTHPCWPYKGTMNHQPQDGDMVLFPAHLNHDIPANPIDTPRINCAFNVALAPKHNTP